jgi:hypothetical protein
MLAGVPDAERPYVEKYISQWDAGLQRQMAEVQSQYAPYEQYAGYDPEELDMATRVWDLFNQDPAGTIAMLQKAADSQSGTQVPPQPQGYAPQGYAPQPQYGANGTGQYGQQQGFTPQLQQGQQYQLPPQVMTMLERQQQFMENMALTQQQAQQAQIEAQQDQEFESYLDAMHRELGEFDDSIVINNMAQGMDPVAAVQAFRSQWQPVPQPGAQGGGPPVPPPVPVLNGGSATPGQVPIAQASAKQRHDVVRAMLDHANAQ